MEKEDKSQQPNRSLPKMFQGCDGSSFSLDDGKTEKDPTFWTAGELVSTLTIFHSSISVLCPKFSRFFGQSKSEEDENPLTISPDIPKGLYLFGDVGTGKR